MAKIEIGVKRKLEGHMAALELMVGGENGLGTEGKAPWGYRERELCRVMEELQLFRVSPGSGAN